jgi:tetratricopeptide (TPR) repeat protein
MLSRIRGVGLIFEIMILVDVVGEGHPGLEMTDPAEEFNQRGNDAFRAERFDDAVKQYSQAIEASPLTAKYYSNRAFCNIHLKNVHEAIADACEAVALAPQTDKFWTRVVTAYANGNFVSHARSCLTSFAVLFPGSSYKASLDKTVADAEARKDKTKKTDRFRSPIPDPGLGQWESLHPNLWFRFGTRIELTPFHWWEAFSVEHHYDDRAYEMHKFFIDAFTLGSIESREYQPQPQLLYAFAAMAHRMSVVPPTFSFTVLMRLAPERLEHYKQRESIKGYWRESPYHSAHIVSALRAIREMMPSLQFMTMSERVISEGHLRSALEYNYKEKSEKPPATIINEPAIQHLRNREKVAVIMKDFQARYQRAANFFEAEAIITLTSSIVRSFAEPSDDGSAEAYSSVVLVHWACSEHAVLWYAQTDATKRALSTVANWNLLLSAFGWTLSVATAPPFLSLLHTLFCGQAPDEIPNNALVAALTSFVTALRTHVRANLDLKAFLGHLKVRPEDYYVRAAVVDEVRAALG